MTYRAVPPFFGGNDGIWKIWDFFLEHEEEHTISRVPISQRDRMQKSGKINRIIPSEMLKSENFDSFNFWYKILIFQNFKISGKNVTAKIDPAMKSRLSSNFYLNFQISRFHVIRLKRAP